MTSRKSLATRRGFEPPTASGSFATEAANPSSMRDEGMQTTVQRPNVSIPNTKPVKPIFETPTRACGVCGKEFQRSIRYRTYCSPDCQREGYRRSTLSMGKAKYWADPEAARAQAREYYAAHREQHRISARKSRTLACTRCGRHTTQSIVPEDRAAYICGNCKKLERRVAEGRYCVECGVILLDRRTAYCGECLGLLTIVGKELGLSRERIRQLANRQVERAADAGYRLFRKDAIALVRADRLGLPRPHVTLRLMAPEVVNG